MYPESFEYALNHAMLYEVGKFWKLTPEVEAGLIETREQRRAVGYVNIPEDRGGETKFGIAQKANPEISVRDLTWEGAKEVYFRKYWLLGRCDQLSDRLAIMHFDGCVNHGVVRANRFLQQAVGAEADGKIGPVTLDAINDDDPMRLCSEIADLRVGFYHRIVERDASQGKFLKGWLIRIDEIRAYVLGNTFN